MISSIVFSSFSLALFILLIRLESHNASVIYFAKADLDDKHRNLVSFKVYEETEDYDYSKKELTCFTCDKSRSNDECNKKAIDEPCSQKLFNADRMRELTKAASSAYSQSHEEDLTALIAQEHYETLPATAACLTIHKFNSVTHKTISVEKRCASDCRADMVGCTSPVLHSQKSDTVKIHQYIRTCTYCCNKNYCNFDVASSSMQAYNLTNDALLKSNDSTRLASAMATTLIALGLHWLVSRHLY